MRRLVCVAITAALTACAPRTIRTPADAPAIAADAAAYIDLQPGWRLRVVTPLTRSGTYVLHPKQQQNATAAAGGLAFTVSKERDFMGYETAYYFVQPRGRTGVRIEFVSAEDPTNGVTTPQPQPQLMLFQLPKRASYVRLVYLARISRADHDMAIVASTNKDLLDSLTRRLQANPRACVNTEHAFCSWVPAGIAVRPEVPKDRNGAAQWAPAR
jgi:hypothetical protein